MAITFLAAVNDVLMRVGSIKGDAGDLTSFTESSRQRDIDTSILAWNDMIRDLYSLGLFSQGSAESLITLALADREYALPSDFEQFGPDLMREETKQYVIGPYPGGYTKLWNDQVKPSNFTGQPLHYAINPTTNEIRIDTDPGSEQVGDILKFVYTKRLALAAITDTFPFSDTVVDLLGIAVAELQKGYMKGETEINTQLFATGRSRAIAYLRQDVDKERYA